MWAVLSSVLLRYNDVADLAGVRLRCHFVEPIGKMRRTHTSKVGVGLVHGGIGKIVVRAVDGTEVEGTESKCHGSPSLQSVWPQLPLIARSENDALMIYCDVQVVVA